MLEDWDRTTVRDVLRLMGAHTHDIDKYTSYEVTISLEGQQRTYRAMVLYHNGFQSASEPRVEFADNIVGQTVLAQAYYESRPPVRSSWLNYVKTDKYREYAAASANKNGQALQKREEIDVSWPGEWRRANGEFESLALPGSSIAVIPPAFCDNDPGICDPLSCNYPSCLAQTPETDGEVGAYNASCKEYISWGARASRNQNSSLNHWESTAPVMVFRSCAFIVPRAMCFARSKSRTLLSVTRDLPSMLVMRMPPRSCFRIAAMGGLSRMARLALLWQAPP